MLTENDVVEAVCQDLQTRGWTVKSRSLTNQQGVDVVAAKDGKRLWIEAKGEGSSKEGTSRYGLVFDRNQVKTHVAVGVLTALKVVAQGEATAALALPDNAHHRRQIEAIRIPLRTLGIAVFWVRVDGVELEPSGVL